MNSLTNAELFGEKECQKRIFGAIPVIDTS